MRMIIFFLPILCIFSGCASGGVQRSFYVSQSVNNEEIPEEVLMDDSKTKEVIPLGE